MCCPHQGGMRSHVEWAKKNEGREMAREEGKGEEEEQQN